MSVQTHLAELERKHRQLETAIQDAIAHPSTDMLSLAEMKRKKLLIKEEIERMRQAAPKQTVH